MRIQDPKDPQIDYQIKDIPGGLRQNDRSYACFEVTKWTGGRVPENLYTVLLSPMTGKYTCNCPAAFRGACKHIEMVKAFIEAGLPATFPTLEKLEALDAEAQA